MKVYKNAFSPPPLKYEESDKYSKSVRSPPFSETLEQQGKIWMCLSISMPFDLSSPTGTFYVMSHIHCVLPTQYLKLSWLTLTKRLRQPIWIGCEIYEEPQFSENWLQNLCKCIRLAVGVQEGILFDCYFVCTRSQGVALLHSSQNLRRAGFSSIYAQANFDNAKIL